MIGIKPTKVDKNILIFETFIKDRQIFCTISGGPIINLKRIKYSKDEFFIKWDIFDEYFIKFFLNNFFNNDLENKTKNKLPIDIENILIRKPKKKPKKNPEDKIATVVPGKEKVKKITNKEKYKIIDIV